MPRTYPSISSGLSFTSPAYIGAKDGPNREIYSSYITHYLTPETKTSSHYYWSITNDYKVEDDETYAMQKAFAANRFAGDKWATEEIQQPLDNDHIEFKEMVIAGDQAEMLFQGVILGWVLEEYAD